ncbi:MAG: DMT family transporter [Rhodocyclaceae bacterium]|nr:DMT family transporter [Rhodocyclaceae bacterium]
MTERRGIAFTLAAVFVFACMDSTAKYLATRYALPLLVWARYSGHFLLMVVFLAPSHRSALFVTRRLPAQLFRAFLLLGVTSCVISALRTLPLAEATALGYTSPLMAALLAGPWLGEKVGPSRWLALAAGFVGVLFIARPGGALTGEGIAYALAGASCYAIYQVMTRQLSTSENSVTLLFYTALVGTIGSTLILPWAPMGTLPGGMDLAAVAALGALGGLGHFLLIRAFHHAGVATLGPFLYAQLIWAMALGWLLFQHLPDRWSLLGMALVVGSGLAVAVGNRRPATR